MNGRPSSLFICLSISPGNKTRRSYLKPIQDPIQ